MVEAPPDPPWMKRVGLECQCFEHYPRIDALWLKTESRWSGIGVRQLREGEPAEPIEDPAKVARWCEEILASGLDAAGDDDKKAWAQLFVVAEALV